MNYTDSFVLFEWHLATSQFCQNSINYMVTVERADHLSNGNSVVTLMVFGMTTTTVPLQSLMQNQVYTAQVTALISSCDSITATRNFTISGPTTINTTGSDLLISGPSTAGTNTATMTSKSPKQEQ